jgi:hypothetical protein
MNANPYIAMASAGCAECVALLRAAGAVYRGVGRMRYSAREEEVARHMILGERVGVEVVLDATGE